MDWVLPITGIIAMLFLIASMFMDDHHDFHPSTHRRRDSGALWPSHFELTPESETGCQSIRPHRFHILHRTMMCGAVEEI